MTVINANWNRWSLASICKYFHDTFKDDVAVAWPTYIGGVDLGEESDYLDPSKPARLSVYTKLGLRHPSGSEYWIEAAVTMIVTTSINVADPFHHSRYVGTFESKIPQCFNLKKLGPDVVDTTATFCILMLDSPKIDPRVYPAVGMATKVSQSIYTLNYKGIVDGN